ncbi:MAG: VOC family protein [Pseudomonadota bacterium]
MSSIVPLRDLFQGIQFIDPMLALDHLVIVGETVDSAARHIEAALGVPMQAGGAHQAMGTHNRLLGLAGGVYIEAIAIDPAAPAPDRPRWYNLDRFSGEPKLTHWAARTTDIDATLAASPAGTGVPLALTRGPYAWTMAIPETGQTPFDGMSPALLSWDGPHPADALTDRGCSLNWLEIQHPDIDHLFTSFPALAQVDRLRFSHSSQPGLRAEIGTPHGPRLLT